MLAVAPGSAERGLPDLQFAVLHGLPVPHSLACLISLYAGSGVPLVAALIKIATTQHGLLQHLHRKVPRPEAQPSI